MIVGVNGDGKNYTSKSIPPANLFLSEKKASGVIVLLPYTGMIVFSRIMMLFYGCSYLERNIIGMESLNTPVRKYRGSCVNRLTVYRAVSNGAMGKKNREEGVRKS